MLCARVLTSRCDWAWVSMINVELHHTFMSRSSWTGAMLWWYWVALKAALCWAEECAYISWYHQQELNTKLLLRSSGTFCLTWVGRLRLRHFAHCWHSFSFRYSVRAPWLWQYGWYVVVRVLCSDRAFVSTWGFWEWRRFWAFCSCHLRRRYVVRGCSEWLRE